MFQKLKHSLHPFKCVKQSFPESFVVIRGVYLSKQENKNGLILFSHISFCALNTPNIVLNMSV